MKIPKRNVGLCVLFYFITCFIYNIYWIICMTDEANYAAQEDGMSGGVVFLLGVLTCGIFYYYWYYAMGEKIATAQAKRGAQANTSLGVTYLLLGLFGFGLISTILMQVELNKLADTQI